MIAGVDDVERGGGRPKFEISDGLRDAVGMNLAQ